MNWLEFVLKFLPVVAEAVVLALKSAGVNHKTIAGTIAEVIVEVEKRRKQQQDDEVAGGGA